MISVIAPTYNEAENIREFIRRVQDSLIKEYELIIVDDASSDGTIEAARELSCGCPIKIIQRPKRYGLASAVVDGFKVAQGEIFCVIDSDLSHPPEIIPELVKFLEKEKADIVIASRLVKGGGAENWPKTRKIISYIAAILTKPLTSVKDSMSGYFICKKNVVNNLAFAPLGYKILLEILVKGKYSKVTEYPFIFKNRSAGSSKINLKIYLEFFIHLFKLCLFKTISNFKVNLGAQKKNFTELSSVSKGVKKEIG